MNTNTSFRAFIKIKDSWYVVGDTVKMPSFFIFTKKWVVKSIHYDCCAILSRKNKTLLVTGSVRTICCKFGL